MQGKKTYQEKLFVNFQLSSIIPENNFYRRLKENLDLSFLYKETKCFYGNCGQASIDPIVFFKLCLVGYLENIISDRRLVAHSRMRLDILYFLDHDIDESLPWHSTISRTRQLYPEEIFEKVFDKVLGMCVSNGMVSGHTQAIDSAPIKANASMDSLELKVPKDDLETHLRKIRHISQMDKDTPIRKSKNNKASEKQRSITASKKDLDAIKSRNKRWSVQQDQRPGAGNKGSKYTSNKTHYSPTDPDARISVKPGKARKLNYMSQLSVDTAHHVITDIHAYHADKKDNQYLQDITLRLRSKLKSHGLLFANCVADTGYSSGENYAFMESQGITTYIPPHGTYKGGPTGFVYNEDEDHYTCPQGKTIPLTRVFKEKKNDIKKKQYRARKAVCIDCPIRTQCLGAKTQEKKFTVTYYRAEYERAIKRVKSKTGRYMKAKRQSTVEPVFGSLTQFFGLRKINTIGIKQANKVMTLAAIAYNIKKYLKFTFKKADSRMNHAVWLWIEILCFPFAPDLFLRPSKI